MEDKEYIRQLEERLYHAANEIERNKVAMTAILTDYNKLREQFDNKSEILRDQFAMAAPFRFVDAVSRWRYQHGHTNRTVDFEEYLVELALMRYQYADAMINARAAKEAQ